MQYVATQLNQNESSTAVLAEYDKMLYLLARHKKDLKNIQSRAHKTAINNRFSLIIKVGWRGC